MYILTCRIQEELRTLGLYQIYKLIHASLLKKIFNENSATNITIYIALKIINWSN
jgi:hypothetical protein